MCLHERFSDAVSPAPQEKVEAAPGGYEAVPIAGSDDVAYARPGDVVIGKDPKTGQFGVVNRETGLVYVGP